MENRSNSADVPELIVRVRRLMPQWGTDALTDFVYLPAGYSHDNYSFRHNVDRYVIRLPIGARPHSEWRIEKAFYASPGNVLVPEVVAFDIDTGAMISRWVDGPLMEDAPPSGEELVSFLRALHQNIAPAARLYDPIARSKRNLATPGPNQPSSRIGQLVDRSAWPQTRLVTCHNDFNPWNVICTPGGPWVTLDWESHGNNDPLFDLVTMHQGLELDNAVLPGLCDDLLDEPPAPGRVEQVLIAFWTREYAWAFSEWQKGNQRDELRKQMALSEDKLTDIG